MITFESFCPVCGFETALSGRVENRADPLIDWCAHCGWEETIK